MTGEVPTRYNAFRVVVEVPYVGREALDALVEAVATTVDDWSPDDRDWDAGVSAHVYRDELFPPREPS